MKTSCSEDWSATVFFPNRHMGNLIKLWDNLWKLERTESYEQCASDLSRSSGALALHVAQDHNFSDRLFITSGSDFSALVNSTIPSFVWDKATFPSFFSIKSNPCTCRAVYKEGWLLSWGFPVHFHLTVKHRTHLWGHFSVLEPVLTLWKGLIWFTTSKELSCYSPGREQCATVSSTPLKLTMFFLLQSLWALQEQHEPFRSWQNWQYPVLCAWGPWHGL